MKHAPVATPFVWRRGSARNRVGRPTARSRRGARVHSTLVAGTLLLSLCASFLGGARYGRTAVESLRLPWVIERQPITPTLDPPEAAGTSSLLWEAWNVVDHNYVDRSALDAQRMTYGAVSGLIDSLGDAGHSRFLTPDEVRREHDALSGSGSAGIAILGPRPVGTVRP